MANKAGLSNPSQLLLRNLEALRGERILVAGYPADDFVLLLAQQWPDSQVSAFNTDYSAHRFLSERYRVAGIASQRLRFAADYPVEENLPHDVLILFLPKAREQLNLLLALLTPALQPGARILLVGENNAGIRSSDKPLKRYGNVVEKLDSARRCSLLATTLAQPPAPFVLDDWLQQFPIEAGGERLDIVSLPGVFSHGRLDEGTRLLLDHLDLPQRGRVLDIGCGAGVIGAVIKRLNPKLEVDLCDINALGLEAARRTLAANDLPPGRIFASDIFSDVDGRYDGIVTNPPFHTGVKTDYGPTSRLLKEAAAYLKPGGQLTLVANSFLRYPPLIEQHLGSCRTLAETNKFRVYEARAK